DPVTGQRRRFKVRSKTKSVVLAKMREATGKAEKNVAPGAGAITVGDFLDSWLASVVDGRGDSDNTRTSYRQIIDKHLKPGIGSIRLDKLTPEDVDRLLAHKAKNGKLDTASPKRRDALIEAGDTGLSRSYIGRMRTLLADALRHAERRSLVVRNAGALSV